MDLPRRRWARIGLIAGVVVLGLATLVVFFPWNTLRGPVERYASARLERAVTLGALDVDLGRRIRVTADNVTVANVDWAVEQPMVDAKRIVVWFTWGGLFRAVPARLRFEDSSIALERNKEGEDNWHFGSRSGAVPRIGNIEVDRGVVRYRDAKADADVRLSLQTGSGAGRAARIQGRGQAARREHPPRRREHGPRTTAGHGRPVQVPGARDERPDGRGLRWHRGAFRCRESSRDARDLRSRSREAVSRRAHATPWTPPYRLKGEISHSDDVWHYRNITGTVGASDLAGNFKVDTSGKRPATTLDLRSRRFDYKDLGGFVGLPPGGRAIEQHKRDAPRMLPDKPLELAKLREHDVDLRFRGESVKWGSVPIDNLDAHLVLKDGILRFTPANFGLAGGNVVANITIDVTRNVPRAEADVTARNVELKRIFPKLASPRGSAGRVGGHAKFRTQGISVADMMGAAEGEISAIMRGGEASTLTLVLTNLDLARAAELLLRGDQTSEIRCAVTSLRAKQGVVTPDFFVVDTTAVLITGEGSVNFRAETYDAMLRAKSKQASLLALRGPIVIDGTFKDPAVRPAIGPVALRVGAAIGLGAIAPPLALLPLIDFGGAPDADCRNLMQEARMDTARETPPRTAVN